LRSLGHRGAEGAVIDGGVLAIEEGGTLGVGELGDDLGECRMTVERWACGRVRLRYLRTATLIGATRPLLEGRRVVDRLGLAREDVSALRSAMVGGRPYSWMKRRTAAPTSSERAEKVSRSPALMPSTSK
jgi:hypothetical protein